jgi:RNA polymerase sigma-70 factor (ECF subfamily)
VNHFDYEHWLSVAKRAAHRASEAPDLLHDALLEALRTGRTDFADRANQRWFAGVLRNRAAMDARTAVRRMGRERNRVRDRAEQVASVPSELFIDTLPPAARRVAVLIIAGLNRDEIMAALQIAPTAFRQRLTTIRRAWKELPASRRAALSIDAGGRVNGLDLGLLRRALLANVRRFGGVGTHDPDGHLIVLSHSPSRPAMPRQQ